MAVDTLPQHSRKPFVEAFADLLAAYEISVYEIVKRGRQDGFSVSGAWLGDVRRGPRPASVHAMEAIAAAVGIDPAYFAEHRLRKAQEQLDPAVVGLKRALANLEQSGL